MGFCAILSLILVIAKIFSLVTFSWWICLAPFLIAVALKFLLLFIAFLIAMFAD